MSDDSPYKRAHDAIVALADSPAPAEQRITALRTLATEALLLATLLEGTTDSTDFREKLAAYITGLQA